MRTTYTLADERAQALMKRTHSKNLPQALNQLVARSERQQRIDEVMALAGTVKFDYGSDELRGMQAERSRRLHGRRSD